MGPKAMIMGIIGLIFVVMFGSSMFVTIDSGEKGVLFKKFGGGLEKEVVYGQGFHMIAPWNDMFVYDVKLKDTFEKMEVLSKNGLSIKIDLSFRYQPVADSIGYLHDGIGKNFLESIIKPEIRSVTREVIGNYLPEELYSTKREAIEDEIYALTKINIEAKYLRLDAILIRDVTLPTTLRKAIEANGIAKFQKIVNRTITPQLLKWKGVEATQEIAKSQNAKVIVIGNGDGDLPIILGGE